MAFVTVNVEDGKITCTPETVLVTKDSKNLVGFRLETEGCAFPPTGAVVMKKPASDFPEPATTRDATLVELKDLNRVAGLYAYSVTVRDRSGQLLELDPTVSNDGGG